MTQQSSAVIKNLTSSNRGRHAAPYRVPTRALWPVVLAGTGLVLGSQTPAQARQDTTLTSTTAAAPTGADSPVTLASPVLYPLDPVKRPAAPALPADQLALPATPGSRSIPPRVLEAYARAANSQAACGITWSLLAGIGWIESGHAHNGGSGAPGWSGVASPPILGPRLDGNGPWGRIGDSDHGTLDGDLTWDRAVGPMQFIPSTWRRWGSDGNDDGRQDPQSIDDASLSAARYLCAAGDLRGPSGLYQAVYSYNHSDDYVRAVLGAAEGYAANEQTAAVLRNLGPVTASADRGTAAVATSAPPRRPAPTTGQPATRTAPPAPSGTATASATPTAQPAAPATTAAAPTPSAGPTPTPTEVECTC